MNSNIRRLATFLLVPFALLILWLGAIPVYLQQVERKSRYGDAAWPTDPRLLERRQKVAAGEIYDCRGNLLARTKIVNGKAQRVYPFGKACAHVVGYSSPRYGLAGIEAAMMEELTGWSYWEWPLVDEQKGNNVVLTLDASLQQKAMQLIGNRKGALAALDPATGRVLALVSSPSFDPHKIDSVLNTGKGKKDSPLLNRATQGSYAPGSVFKIVTLAAVLQERPGMVATGFNCRGYLQVDGFKLNDSAAHGKMNLKKAFALSCNTVFGSLGLELGAHQLVDTAEDFGFNRSFAFPLPYRPGKIGDSGSMNGPELASTAVGQGSVLANPMQVALMGCAVANGGVIMRPVLVDRVVDDEGNVLRETHPARWLKPMDTGSAGILKNYMIAVVRSGTGREAAIPGIQVAGKTGTAQNAGEDHAWFVGFAPAENPRVVVAVIIENGGSGGTVAAPVAREFIREALKSD